MNEPADSNVINKPIKFQVINDVGPNQKEIHIKFKCISKYEEKIVTSRRTGQTLRVAEALVGDATGCILLTLWNEDIEIVQPNNIYQLSNGYTSIFKGSLRLNVGKYGNLEAIEDNDFGEVNEKKNLSNLIFELDKLSRRKRTYKRDRGYRPFKGYLRRY